MSYTYQAIMQNDGDGWTVAYPQFPGFVTQGETREEAAANAADLLTLAIAEYVEDGKQLPRQSHVVECLTVSVKVEQDDMDETHYMTMQQAQEVLGVGASRVSQMAKSGKLESRMFGRRNMVSIESVNHYASSPRKAGRPSTNG